MTATLLSLLLAGCEVVPKDVEPGGIDEAVVMGRYRTVCRGLDMKDDRTRRYAAEKLAAIQDPIAEQCICDHAIDGRTGAWDEAILAGLKGSPRDDLVRCFLPAMDDSRDDRKLELVVALSMTDSPLARATVVAVAGDATRDAALRARAVDSLAGTADPDQVALLARLIASDPEPSVRAAAATALGGHEEPELLGALRTAASKDAEGTVRAAALAALKRSDPQGSDQAACTAMMEDPSPEVRRQAVLAFRGTKRDEAVACLRRRALEQEDDASVRDALLLVLKGSPASSAPAVLCDAIPFWVRTYVKDLHPDRVPGTDILSAQNDRDWQHSYECFERAWRARSGYTCKGRQYVGAWFREVGGKVHIPRCPGDPPSD